MKKHFVEFLADQIVSSSKMITKLASTGKLDVVELSNKIVQNKNAILALLNGKFADVADADKALTVHKYFVLAQETVNMTELFLREPIVKSVPYYNSVVKIANALSDLCKNVIKYQSWCKGIDLRECHAWENHFASLLRRVNKLITTVKP